MKNENLVWQTRDEMLHPTNPLQRLRETFAFTSRDCGEDKMIAFMYGIIVGWDDGSYEELKSQHNWSEKDIELQKMWHANYNEVWNLFMERKVEPKFHTPFEYPTRVEGEEFSVDVFILDELGVHGIAFWNFDDKVWRFHTDTLVDYNEPNAETKWKWYYPPYDLNQVFNR